MKKANLVVLVVFQGCVSMNIGSQETKNANYEQFKTYAWIYRAKEFRHADPKIDNDIVESNLISYCNKELAAKGLTVDTLEPDLLLDFNIVTEQKMQHLSEPIYSTNTYRQSPYYYNPYPSNNPYNAYSPYNSYNRNTSPSYLGPTTYISGYKSVDIPYEDGTVTIYILNRKTQKLIWSGYAEGSVDDVQSFERELPLDIKAIFKRYPVKKITH